MVAGRDSLHYPFHSSKGRSHKLLRKAILKHSKDEKKREEEEMDQQLESIPLLQKEIFDLKELINQKDNEIDLYSSDRKILTKLLKMGVIDRDSNPLK